MPNVYLPTIPMRYDADTGGKCPAIDVTPAADFGESVLLLDLDQPLTPLEMPLAIIDLRNRLSAIRTEDFLVCVGDPVLIAAAAEFAIRKNGTVKMLRWNRIDKFYQVLELKR